MPDPPLFPCFPNPKTECTMTPLPALMQYHAVQLLQAAPRRQAEGQLELGPVLRLAGGHQGHRRMEGHVPVVFLGVQADGGEQDGGAAVRAAQGARANVQGDEVGGTGRRGRGGGWGLQVPRSIIEGML